MGKVLQRLVVWLAFAGALLAPALARAALLPACDGHEQLTRARPAAPAPAAPLETCDAGAPTGLVDSLADEVGDARVPAMCDDRAASVIAPQRVLPVADDRIEAAPCADDGQDRAPSCAPGPKHSPAATPAPALAEHAVLDAESLVPPASSEPAQPFLPVAGGPLLGFVRGIDHPPR